MSKNFNWSLLDRKWTGVDRVEVSASGLEDLASHTSRIESNLCDQKVELDTLSTRFTALMQQNNTLAAENELLSEKLAAMESQEPVYFWKEIGETDWMECHKGWYLKCVDSPEHDTKLLYAKPVPADRPAVAVPDARILDLAERLVAPGPKCCALSASECHEISDFIRDLAAAPSHSQQSGTVAEVVQLNQERYATVLSAPGVKFQRGDKLYIDRCPSHESEQGGVE